MNKNMEPFIDSKTISSFVRRIVGEIHARHPDTPPTILVVLEGGRVFSCQLFSCWATIFSTFFQMYCCTSSSYKGTNKVKDPILEFSYSTLNSLKGKNVIIVDDIAETGCTLQAVKKRVLEANPKSVEICVMVSRKNNRKVSLDLDYVGIEINDPRFLVGMGLDYNGKYRNLPFIGVLQ